MVAAFPESAAAAAARAIARRLRTSGTVPAVTGNADGCADGNGEPQPTAFSGPGNVFNIQPRRSGAAVFS